MSGRLKSPAITTLGVFFCVIQLCVLPVIPYEVSHMKIVYNCHLDLSAACKCYRK